MHYKCLNMFDPTKKVTINTILHSYNCNSQNFIALEYHSDDKFQLSTKRKTKTNAKEDCEKKEQTEKKMETTNKSKNKATMMIAK